MDDEHRLQTINVLVQGELTRERFAQATLPGQWVEVKNGSAASKNVITFKRNVLN